MVPRVRNFASALAPRQLEVHVAPPTAKPVSPNVTLGKLESDSEPKGKTQRSIREEAMTVDALDPSTRMAAQLAPPMAAPPVHVSAASAGSARLSLEEIMPQLVRRIAWAGDKRKGSVRLELGAGAYAGSTITVHAEDGRVRLEVDGADGLRSKLERRLRRRGVSVE